MSVPGTVETLPPAALREVRNIAYLCHNEPAGSHVETMQLSDERNVDLAPDGTVYGIELLNANKQLRGAGAYR